jgi:hypothetical protein
MGSDFAVIIRVRQHFGNDPGFMPEVHFAGNNETYPFSCPDVDPSQEAVLLFQTLGVSHDRNFIEVNSTGPLGQIGVHGGIPVSRSNEDWNANVMLIGPQVLHESNVLSLGSRASNGSLLGDIDEFLIDNVVVLYKTRRSRRFLSRLGVRIRARRSS